MKRHRLVTLVFAILFVAVPAQGQAPDTVAGIPVNYDEARTGRYTLPDPLRRANGEPVRDVATWYQERRAEIVRRFEEHQFGRTPPPAEVHVDVFDEGSPAFDSTALRKQVTVYLSDDRTGPKMDLLIYLPVDAREPVPLLLNPSFSANRSRVDDPGVKRGDIWNRDHQKVSAPESTEFGRLDVTPFLAQGFGVAMVYYGDIEPDFQGGITHGVRALYLEPGQTEPAPDEWGAIAAWSWGLSRAMDYFETDPDVDERRVALLGVSRLGKTVLWTGARDPRFAMVIASCSGEGGAALSRRNYGETIAHLTAPSRYPYQFAANYAAFGDRVHALPVDAHMLIALIAPRPLLLQTGTEDHWSDPKGEFLAAVAASPVYELLGAQGLGTDQMPPAGRPILHTLGYYMHEGGHGVRPSDWDVFRQFMQKHLQPQE